MVNIANILVRPNEKLNKNFCSHFGIDYKSLLFVSNIDYRQFFAFCLNYRYRFVFAFEQHRLPTLGRLILRFEINRGTASDRP